MTDNCKIDVEGFDELIDNLQKVAHAAPDLLRDAVNSAGNKMKRDVTQLTAQRIKSSYTKNLLQGYKKTTRLKKGSFGVWEADVSGGNKKAFHFHLVEHGHKRHEQYFPLPKGKGAKTRWAKSSAGFTEGYHMMEDTIDDWSSKQKLTSYAEKAVKKAIKKGFIDG